MAPTAIAPIIPPPTCRGFCQITITMMRADQRTAVTKMGKLSRPHEKARFGSLFVTSA